MPTKPKLLVTRTTRVDEDIARELARVGQDLGLRDAQVDRAILERIVEIIRRHWKPGQALTHFLRGLRHETA